MQGTETKRVTYTREQLLEICELACCPQSDWGNRDTAQMIRQLAEVYVLLKCGCGFVCYERDWQAGQDKTFSCEVTFNGFGYFDYGGAPETVDCYMPHLEFVKARRAKGDDWYC